MRSGDAALAAGVAAVAVSVTVLAPVAAPYRPAGWLSVTVAAAAGLALARWRVRPVWTVGATGTAVVLLAALRYDVGVVPWATWIALYGCVAVGTVRERYAGGALAAAGVAGYLVATPTGRTSRS